MFLGIDTSCYTTSIALIYTDGKLFKDYRRLLNVEKGSIGISQSQGFFLHNNQLPLLFEKLYQGEAVNNIKGVAVSEKPRPQEGSYMPVFRAGLNMAKLLSHTMRVPLYTTTHQEGHLAAALWSIEEEKEAGEEFLALHISGGTTELLKVQKLKYGYNIEVLADSDLACGQYIDRIGVAMGLSFPAGPELEEIAKACPSPGIKLPVAVKGLNFSFSGPESQARRLLKKDIDKKELAAAVFISIGEALAKVISNAFKETGHKDVLLAGGVASNSIIKGIILQRLEEKGNLLFSHPEFARDNAVGVALMGREKALS